MDFQTMSQEMCNSNTNLYTFIWLVLLFMLFNGLELPNITFANILCFN